MAESGVEEMRAREAARPESDRATPLRRRSDSDDSGDTGQEDDRPRSAPDTRPTPPGKRALDVLLSLIGLLLTSPAWVLLPVLIKLEDGGPVFFAQERVGKGGERFTCWKFRSMRPRSESNDGPASQAEREADRITRIGAFMRPRALDELPQLWNVLRGDISLVGPRALLPEEIEARSEDGEPVRLEELPGYEERHSVRPGLTGLAQTGASRDLPHRQKFHYDVLYARSRSLWLDLRLILRSVGISLLGEWPEIEHDDGERASSLPDEAESPA